LLFENRSRRKTTWFVVVYPSFFFFLPLQFLYFFLIIWNRAFIFFLKSFVIFTLYAKSNEKRKRRRRRKRKEIERVEREGERLNQTAGDVRSWRRTNSMHLGARERIRWHNQNIWNRKSPSLSFSTSFLYVVISNIFMICLILSSLLVEIIVNLLSSIRVQLYSVVNIFLLFIHQVVLWPS